MCRVHHCAGGDFDCGSAWSIYRWARKSGGKKSGLTFRKRRSFTEYTISGTKMSARVREEPTGRTFGAPQRRSHGAPHQPCDRRAMVVFPAIIMFRRTL